MATPDTSAHVSGDAVDIGPSDAAAWLSEHGAAYGLCQIYGNEPWHYELRPEADRTRLPAHVRRPDPRSEDAAVKLRALTALAIVALIGAGCGSNAASETGGDEQPTDRDKAVKFAECVRQNGVSDFPDPNAKGDFEYGVSVSPAVWKQAIDACRELQPPGTLSAKRSPEQQSASLKFAQCIRENGVKDFPDPVNGEPLVDTRRIPSTDGEGGMTILNAAMHKCRALVAEAAGSQP